MSTQSAPATPTRGAGKRPGQVAYRWAWLSLLLDPFTVVAAFVVGEGLLSLVADDEADPAFWQMLVSATPALLVFIIPGVLSVVLGRRAVRLGEPQGKVPALLGAGIAAAFVGINLFSGLLIVLFG